MGRYHVHTCARFMNLQHPCSVWVGNHPSGLLVVTGVWGTSLWLAWCAKRYQPSGREGNRVWNFQVAHRAWKMKPKKHQQTIGHVCQRLGLPLNWTKVFALPKLTWSFFPCFLWKGKTSTFTTSFGRNHVKFCEIFFLAQKNPLFHVACRSTMPCMVDSTSRSWSTCWDWFRCPLVRCVHQNGLQNGNDGEVMKMNKLYTIPKLYTWSLPIRSFCRGLCRSYMCIFPLTHGRFWTWSRNSYDVHVFAIYVAPKTTWIIDLWWLFDPKTDVATNVPIVPAINLFYDNFCFLTSWGMHWSQRFLSDQNRIDAYHQCSAMWGGTGPHRGSEMVNAYKYTMEFLSVELFWSR